MRPLSEPRERGTVVVELAVVLPLLALFLVAVVDLGVLLWEHEVVQNAAREGARYSILPWSWIDPRNPGASEAEIKQRVIDYLQRENVTVDAGSITIDQQYPIVIGEMTAYGSEVVVDYERRLLIPGLLGGGPVRLSGRAVFRNLY